jgi:putative N6-adenine-specific DNA methylase
MPHHHCFAVCAPGLEALVADELATLGVRRSRAHAGGVTFDATTRQLYAANVWSRIATRILVRVTTFAARDFATLERQLGLVDWPGHLDPDRPVRVRVTSSRSRLYHTAAIEQRLRRGLGGAAERDTPDSAADQLIVVRVVRDEVTISIDTSGAPLHRRGWRTESAKAPLRETLAAAMVIASGWRPSDALVDPFCGSGTIAIEAACHASGRAPGSARPFAFEQAPGFEPGTYASVRADVQRAVRSYDGTIVASDRDAGAIETTEANAARAGVSHLVTARRASVSDLGDIAMTPPGWILSNPPYGKRVSAGGDLRNLFARFGDVARGSFPEWSVGLLVADRRAAGHTRLPLTERFHTTNGGIPVQFLTGAVSVRRGP